MNFVSCKSGFFTGVLIVTTSALVLSACSSSSSSSANGSDGGSGGDGGGGSGSCSGNASLIFVIDDVIASGAETQTLHTFDPSSLQFQTIGKVACPDPGSDSLGVPATPRSMAIDGNGTAWVNFTSGKLFKVSTKDGSCAATSFVPAADNSQWRWAMAFESSGGSAETLFVASNNASAPLSTFDTNALTLTTLGDFTDGLSGQQAVLAGDSNGGLYGLVTDDLIAKIDPSTGATPKADQHQSITPSSYGGMAQWGGDLWAFQSTDLVNPSASVTQIKSSSDFSIVKNVASTTFGILVAASSSCAPTSH
jgi:hypothetical protein